MADRDVGVELYKPAAARGAKGEIAGAARLSSRARQVLLEADDLDGACAAALLEGHFHLRAGELQVARECIEWVEHEAEANNLNSRYLSALTDRGALLEMAGDLGGAVEAHQLALGFQREGDDSAGIATSAGNLGRLLTRLLQPDEARELLEESLGLFRQIGNRPGVVNALICIGDLERGAGNLEAAEQALAEAIEQSNTEQLALLRGVAQLNRGHILRDRGQATAAMEAFDASLEVSETLGDVRGVARARLAQALTLADSSTPERSLEAFVAAEQAFLSIGQPAGAIAATVNKSAVLCRIGDLVQGRAGLEAAHDTLLQAGDQRAALEVGLALADVYLAMGDAAGAEGLVERLQAEQGGARLVLRKALVSARLSVRSGLLEDARSQVEAAQIDEASASERFACGLHDAELAILSGDPRAADLLADLLETADPDLNPREYAAARMANGQFEQWRGELELAEASYREALGRWQAIGEALPTLYASGAIWRTEALAGRPPAPAPAFDAVATLADHQAADAAAGMRALATTLATVAGEEAADPDDEAMGPDAIAAAVFPLLASGNRLAASIELAFAAIITGDEGLVDEARRLFSSTDVVPPRWFDPD